MKTACDVEVGECFVGTVEKSLWFPSLVKQFPGKNVNLVMALPTYAESEAREMMEILRKLPADSALAASSDVVLVAGIRDKRSSFVRITGFGTPYAKTLEAA